jgi:YegS/Rv2252/BmrU family lipid kinase
MKTFLVVNPGSAGGQTGRRWAELSAKVGRRLGGGWEHAFTERPMHAVELTTRALDEGYECVVAVGGDGTINEVANGFFRDGQVINPQAALGVIPRGTGGDFRKSFGWDGELDPALARLAGPATAPLDVGLVEFVDNDGRPARRFFVNVCSFGISGLVDREVNARSKLLGGKLSFMLGSVRALIKYTDARVRLQLDGAPAQELTVTTVAVANGRYFGGGMMIAPEARTDDGLFDITVWSGYGLVDFALRAGALYDGSHVRLAGTRLLRGHVLDAACDDGRELLLDVDGEQPGRLPCRISILPAALRLKT